MQSNKANIIPQNMLSIWVMIYYFSSFIFVCTFQFVYNDEV